MLVLKLKAGSVVEIEGGVRIQVIGFDGRKVRLGFDAPPQVQIARVKQEPQQEAKAA